MPDPNATMTYPIEDYDDAYANAAHIERAADYPLLWASRAKAFRQSMAAESRHEADIAYGPVSRQVLDLFRPAGLPRGLVVFVHGGYWKAFDKSDWSHLAAGPLAHGYAVALPSYTLCPEARIGAIGSEIAAAVACAAAMVDGPILLAGHSAGGQLVARMVCAHSPLAPGVGERIAHVMPISGVHDLRPLMRTRMNEILRIDPAEAAAESPVLAQPRPGGRITCWVGADERPEFVRQNRILSHMWKGFAVETECVEEAGRHHFNVIDGLADPESGMTRALVLA